MNIHGFCLQNYDFDCKSGPFLRTQLTPPYPPIFKSSRGRERLEIWFKRHHSTVRVVSRLVNSNFVYAKFLQQFSLLILLQFYFATKSLTDFVADGICNNFPYWFCCIFKVQQNPLLILLHFENATKSVSDFVALWKCNKISKGFCCKIKLQQN